jgi:hypothetical protein
MNCNPDGVFDMNLSTRIAASALSFAHLASVGRGKQAKADDKDKDYRDKDDDKEARAKADDENDDDDSKAKADEPGADDDDDEEDKKQKSPDGKKSKRAKAEEDDDDDGGKKKDDDEDDSEEMHGKSAAARARLREQARCAAIMGCRAAGRNVVLAAQLALTTRMTREEAIGVLETTPAATVPGQGREARNPRLGGGGEHAQDSKTALAASWDRAFEKVGAVRRK